MMFTYAPLDRTKSEIRVLRLQPSEDADSPLEGSLEHISLNIDSDYEAISYTWGDNVKTNRISFGGVDFAITSNLAAALRVLRRKESDRSLWVDAICINQDDIPERSQEVLRMLSIYQHASKVVVWLGEASEDSSSAIIYLRNLAATQKIRENFSLPRKAVILFFKTLSKALSILAASVEAVEARPLGTVWVVAYLTNWIPHVRFLTPLIIRPFTYWKVLQLLMRAVQVYLLKAPRITDKFLYPPSDAALKGLTNFFSRPWFYRVWIIQEIAGAKDAIVVCGRDWLSWTEFCDACDEIYDMVAKTSTKNPFIDTGFNGTSPIRGLGRRRALGAPEADWSLMKLLVLFHCYRATDAHDKVYALLGLAKEIRANYDMTSHTMILPDYNDTLPVTFTAVVWFMVMNTSQLDILRCCEGAWRMKGLPTWVPDWTVIVPRGFNVPKTETKPYALDSDPSPSTPIARFNDDLTTMTVRGFLIGHFVDDGHVMYSTKDPAGPDQLKKFGINFDWILWFARHAQSLFIRSGLGSLLLTSIFNVVGYFSPELKPSLALYKEMFADLGRQWDEDFSADKAKPKEGREEALPISGHNLFHNMVPGQEEEEFANQSFTWEHTLEEVKLRPPQCHTYSPQARKGDLICLLIGAGEPYLLREVEGTGDFLLVGAARVGPFVKYIWRDCEREYAEGKLELKDFVLR
jgi:hypothetical protein